MLPDRAAFYDTADASGALRLLFVPINDGLQAMARALERFAPTVVIAPPQSLRWLAENEIAIAPERVFSGAEVLDPLDRAIIERAFPRAAPIGEIYMASEGLFAVSLPARHAAPGRGLRAFRAGARGRGPRLPIVTDITRTTQIMARYRMNDLLRLGPDCPCGSPLQPLAAVEGRCDDAFLIEGPDGAGAGVVTVTPDVLRARGGSAPRRSSTTIGSARPARGRSCCTWRRTFPRPWASRPARRSSTPSGGWARRRRSS